MQDDRPIRDPQTYAVIGAAMEVHRENGHGMAEVVYQDSLDIEFRLRQIPNVGQSPIDIYYKGHLLPCKFRADFVCFGELLVELKALSQLGDNEVAQVINYLKATGMKKALLINFGAPALDWKRLVN
jgi:GxxExxY protein